MKCAFLSVDTKAGQCATGLGMGTPCAFSEDSLVPGPHRENRERKTSVSLEGAGHPRRSPRGLWSGVAIKKRPIYPQIG